MTTLPDEAPEAVDVYVGLQLRAARHAAGMSQSALGDALGVSFQQVQKYERGSNRVSASMLHRAATALGVEVPYFFEGLPQHPHQEHAALRRAREFALTEDGLRLNLAAAEAPQAAVRAAALLLEARA